MANIYEITRNLIQQRGDVKAAIVKIDGDPFGLHIEYTPSGLDTWFNCLGVINGNSFTGCIWFESGSYAYLDKDGAGYYWNYVAVPEIPEELK